MQYTIQQIIENQKEFKENITKYLLSNYVEAKKLLDKINTDDKFIKNEVEKLSNKFKKTKHIVIINQLFFMNSKRNEKFYAWWDKDNKEVNILKYDR